MHIEPTSLHLMSLNSLKFVNVFQTTFSDNEALSVSTQVVLSHRKKTPPNKQPYKGDKFETALRLHLEPQHTWHPHSWALILLFQNCI